LGFDGLNNPELVAQDPVLAFKTAVWFWMTPQAPKPSCHDVMLGYYTPTATDTAAGRVPGFGECLLLLGGTRVRLLYVDLFVGDGSIIATVDCLCTLASLSGAAKAVP
jgi:hypothetical protein